MIKIKHSEKGSGSVIFNDNDPLILIRGDDWTFYKTKITVHSPPKELQRELVRLALTEQDREKTNDRLFKLGVEYPFEYTVRFREQSIKFTEMIMAEF